MNTLAEFSESLLPALGIILGTLLLQLVSFSRTKEFPPFWVLTAGAVYTTLGHLYWSYILTTSIWFGDEVVFCWSTYPTLPASTVYFGMLWIAVTFAFMARVWSTKSTYKIRQKIGYTLASALCLYGLYITLTIPINIQNRLDALPLFDS